MSKDIKTTIKCKNLAPIVNLDKEIMSSSLKFAIYANNGEGKTFISNMFRLTENKKGDILNDNKLLTDKFISFGKSSSEFSFKISENQKIMEDFKIEINKGSMPNIPPTKYIYHVFNQLYIDENSKVNYDKDGNITDYIIGKGNIDISEEKGLLEEKTEEKSKLEIETKTTLSAAIEQKIGNIQNIKRLNEFKEYLNYNKISDSSIITFKGIDKSFKEYIIDYDKIKSVPENLAIINEIPRIELDTELFISIREELQVQFNLSKVADEFKEKILQKKSFIEQGLKLLNKKDICPFCEQDLKSNELKLIDEYTAFLNDEENKT
ncbi:MAG: hypothetical protein PF638_14395, partial [Candidatus Delongbacteria bacterium]|nr:hypothetical protein [Candidatus Delongbacteria bacterium]